jgi:ribosome biogenesis SPOUT family RNA methylase Rps3
MQIVVNHKTHGIRFLLREFEHLAIIVGDLRLFITGTDRRGRLVAIRSLPESRSQSSLANSDQLT